MPHSRPRYKRSVCAPNKKRKVPFYEYNLPDNSLCERHIPLTGRRWKMVPNWVCDTFQSIRIDLLWALSRMNRIVRSRPPPAGEKLILCSNSARIHRWFRKTKGMQKNSNRHQQKSILTLNRDKSPAEVRRRQRSVSFIREWTRSLFGREKNI